MRSRFRTPRFITRRPLSWGALMLLSTLLLALAAPTGAGGQPAAAPGDAGWRRGFGRPGVTGSVHALSAYNGSLIVGGTLTQAGDSLTSLIARWDGADWHPLGQGLDGWASDPFGAIIVSALLDFNGTLIAGGDFQIADGRLAKYVAGWDGTSWSPLGSGLNGPVRALTEYGGALVAGVSFAEGGRGPYLASWDGTAWSPVGSDVLSWVESLAVFNGRLIVGGALSKVGGTLPVGNIAAWDGTAWSKLGTGLNDRVSALAVYNGELIAGGWFTRAGGIPVGYVARWNGSAWDSLGSGMNRAVFSLEVIGPYLYAGGYFGQAGGVQARRIARWDGTTWTPVGSGIMNKYPPYSQSGSAAVYALADFYGDLAAGGYFQHAGDETVNKIALWDGSTWSALGDTSGKGFNSEVLSLLEYGSSLIAGGYFGEAGKFPVNRIAAWNGSDWRTLGSGFDDVVRALVVHGGELIAGGDFPQAGDSALGGVAAWDGTAWRSLGSGFLGGGSESRVYSLAGYGSDLIAGGRFTQAGDTSAAYIAAWDGSSWRPLGAGMGGSYSWFGPWVKALTVFEGDLIAGGWFGEAGNIVVNKIARWDGTAWHPLSGGVSGVPLPAVDALTVYEGKLIVGGSFHLAGGVTVRNVASWDGSSWTAMGDLWGGVHALAVYNGVLIAGGAFGSPTSPPSKIAWWDGTRWRPLGSGIRGTVVALATWDGGLFAGGGFGRAGNQASFHIARWDSTLSTAVGVEITLPGDVRLEPGYPNPFNPRTTLAYTLPRAGLVTLTIHDAGGRRIATLVRGAQDAGRHTVTWDGTGEGKAQVASGVYFARLAFEGEVERRKLVLIK